MYAPALAGLPQRRKHRFPTDLLRVTGRISLLATGSSKLGDTSSQWDRLVMGQGTAQADQTRPHTPSRVAERGPVGRRDAPDRKKRPIPAPLPLPTQPTAHQSRGDNLLDCPGGEPPDDPVRCRANHGRPTITSFRPDRTYMSHLGIMALDPDNRKYIWRSVEALYATVEVICKEEYHGT